VAGWLAVATGLAALAVDVGGAMLVRSRLQGTADATALAAAHEYQPDRALKAAQEQLAEAALREPSLLPERCEVEFGAWDSSMRVFTPSATFGGAVRVWVEGDASGAANVFARWFGNGLVSRRTWAVAAACPRDIVFLVDLSGAMNDESQQPASGDRAALQALYDDLGWGQYPGASERVDASGDLVPRGLASAAAIGQIARQMPQAVPEPCSDANRRYWGKYLDYVLGAEDSSGLRPMASPESRNRIGYASYLEFLLACGRDLRPDDRQYSPLSRHSPLCRWHSETTPAGPLRFPPREQPMHAVRRALVAAIETVRERNEAIDDPTERDRVALVTFDTLTGGGPLVRQPLADDYSQAMQECARLQPVGDKGHTRATDSGLLAAERVLRDAADPRRGRIAKIVVLVTAGQPDLHATAPEVLASLAAAEPSPEFYPNGPADGNAALAQVRKMQAGEVRVYPVGVGRGCDRDFLDRIARLADTADEDGHAPAPSLDPAGHERQLTDAFVRILAVPEVRLVQ
jgi:hypothetical protein